MRCARPLRIPSRAWAGLTIRTARSGTSAHGRPGSWAPTSSSWSGPTKRVRACERGELSADEALGFGDASLSVVHRPLWIRTERARLQDTPIRAALLRDHAVRSVAMFDP